MMLSVYFPVASRRKPEFHVLSIRWSVGKCIDTLAARGALHNLNNVPGAPRLALFNKAGARLGVAGSLEQCVISGMLEGGDPVVLEFGEMLESFDPKKLKSVKEASGSDCSIQ
ncbi:hypothetical protein T484DRAFT_3045042 [Baffinella frigidus]|nr:hypothetical protein T484DRAFT_3045042 [Cryptophyta sp. CCMP2293]